MILNMFAITGGGTRDEPYLTKSIVIDERLYKILLNTIYELLRFSMKTEMKK